MRCFYNTGDHLCDFIGKQFNGGIWVHGTSDGSDWGKRVFIHSVKVNPNSKRCLVSVAYESERAVTIHITLDPKTHEKLAEKGADVYDPISWEEFVNTMSNVISAVKDGVETKIKLKGIWRERVLDLVYVSDDAIHIMPTDDGEYEVRVPVWFRDVLAEEGVVYADW